MDFATFINQNWQTLGGIASVIFMAGVFYNKTQDMLRAMNEQKENHDKMIAQMAVKVATLETKCEEMKDKTFSVISLMQQDIREIMTILKRDK